MDYLQTLKLHNLKRVQNYEFSFYPLDIKLYLPDKMLEKITHVEKIQKKNL